MTMGIGYCQWGGAQDDRKAIEHFGKALHHYLPPTVLLEVYLERGGCKWRLKQKQAALEDYLRGLAECLRYQLPLKPPQDLYPNVSYSFVFFEGEDSPDAQHMRQLIEDQDMGIWQYRFEEVMIRERDQLIESAKHASGGDAEQIRLVAEAVVNDKSKIPQLVALLTQPNPKPQNLNTNTNQKP